ncbi:MAG: 50S ribosomal protein L23 [Candidatus Gracilibacteria bacterium]|jgi:large subunit ribosomal protein L23
MKILDKVKKVTKKAETEKVEKTEVKNAGKDFKKNKISKDKISTIVFEPLFTEKTSNLMPLNKYAFKVATQANKIEVKKAIEGLYSVNVVSVNILKTASKPKRIGRHERTEAGFKKAIVTLKAGETIEPAKK